MDEEVFKFLEAHGSSLIKKIQNKKTEDDSQDHAPQGAYAPARPHREDEEEEKVEEQVENENSHQQDFLMSKVSCLTRSNSDMNERLEKLEVQVESLCNIMQGNDGQDVEQNDEEQSVNDRLSLPSGDNSRLQVQMKALSHTVVRMELEIKLLKLTQAEIAKASSV